MLDQHTSHAVVVEPRTGRPVGAVSTLDIAGTSAGDGADRLARAALPAGARRRGRGRADRGRADRQPPARAAAAAHAPADRAHAARGLRRTARARRPGALPSGRRTVFQLDEYRGLGPQDERSFAAYLQRELRGIAIAAFHGLDGAAADPDGRVRAPPAAARRGADRPRRPRTRPRRPRRVRRARLEPGERHARRRSASADARGRGRGVRRPRARPPHALTVGLRTLLAARELLVIVTGAGKTEALRTMLLAPPGSGFPASLLRTHPRLTLICDAPAATALRGLRRRRPRLRRARPPRPRLQPRAPDLPRIAGQGAAGRRSPSAGPPAPRCSRATLDRRPLRGRADAGGLAPARACRRCSRSPGATPPATPPAPSRSCSRSAASRCHCRHVGVAHSRAVHVRALASPRPARPLRHRLARRLAADARPRAPRGAGGGARATRSLRGCPAAAGSG